MTKWTRSYIDRLGDMLREESPVEMDTFEALQEYFATLEPFADATFAGILRATASAGHAEQPSITRRRIKTLTSIREKLRRQSTKLSQVQDIVGCRIVVRGLLEQDAIVAALSEAFGNHIVIQDRRNNPKNGYRAVHAIVREDNYRFEIQIRTRPQDAWASGMESIADALGNEVKYGGGPPAPQKKMQGMSESIHKLELALREMQLAVAAGDYTAAKKAGDVVFDHMADLQGQTTDDEAD